MHFSAKVRPGCGFLDCFLAGIAIQLEGSRLDRFTDRVWYSAKYGAAWKDTDIQKRPLDCDWWHAPLGDKGCHYQKTATGFGPADRRRLIEQASTPQERQNAQQTPLWAIVGWERKAD